MTETEKALQLASETEIVLRIGEVIGNKRQQGDATFSNLTEPESVFIFIDMLERQVNNGGFDQFFFNSSGDYAHEICSAYEKIKAYKTANLIETAIKAFPVLPVPKDTEVRREYMPDINDEISKVWDDLDNKFYEYEENIAGLLIEYVKQNSSEIG